MLNTKTPITIEMLEEIIFWYIFKNEDHTYVENVIELENVIY